MGWKLAVVIAKVDGRNLQAFVDELYGTPQKLTDSDVPVHRAFYPTPLSQSFLLQHNGVFWVFDWKLVKKSFSTPLPTSYPLWTFVLHSVVNWYGFTLQDVNKHVRCKSGSSDEGISIDFGVLSELERRIVTSCAKPGDEAKALEAWNDASKTFCGLYEDDESHESIGEAVVFGLIEGVAGFRPDMNSPATDTFLNARVMTIEPRKRSVFGWLTR